jgi:hypothetical protein
LHELHITQHVFLVEAELRELAPVHLTIPGVRCEGQVEVERSQREPLVAGEVLVNMNIDTVSGLVVCEYLSYAATVVTVLVSVSMSVSVAVAVAVSMPAWCRARAVATLAAAHLARFASALIEERALLACPLWV